MSLLGLMLVEVQQYDEAISLLEECGMPTQRL